MFSGTLVAYKAVADSGAWAHAEIQVDKVWLGALEGDTVDVWTAGGSTCSDLLPPPGSEVQVFAAVDNGNLTTFRCSGIIEPKGKARDLRAFVANRTSDEPAVVAVVHEPHSAPQPLPESAPTQAALIERRRFGLTQTHTVGLGWIGETDGGAKVWLLAEGKHTTQVQTVEKDALLPVTTGPFDLGPLHVDRGVQLDSTGHIAHEGVTSAAPVPDALRGTFYQRSTPAASLPEGCSLVMLKAQASLSLSAEPGGSELVKARSGFSVGQREPICVLQVKGDHTEVFLQVPGIEGRLWTSTAALRQSEHGAYGMGFGSGSFSGASWVVLAEDTEARLPGGGAAVLRTHSEETKFKPLFASPTGLTGIVRMHDGGALVEVDAGACKSP